MGLIESSKVVCEKAHSETAATMIGVRTEQTQVVVVLMSRVGLFELFKDLHDQLHAGAEKLLEHRFELCFVRLAQFRASPVAPRRRQPHKPAWSTPSDEEGRS